MIRGRAVYPLSGCNHSDGDCTPRFPTTPVPHQLECSTDLPVCMRVLGYSTLTCTLASTLPTLTRGPNTHHSHHLTEWVVGTR